ncbi:type II toxin-antitoxin system VapC family toxin [Pseudomonas sp. CBSPBW29]|jgi:PIN domain nuclease of toxin-antitoxin system|uniref:Type II toxin-antitoxin system VapC family toxin n=1 Tax=Pseudomonas yamanorum TaxID=515393 RepID=A0ABU1CRM6_9PSED|nr:MULTISPECIES: type II toxin-antitoxin system VapC family toxin [Pseudomonas]WEL44104.1 type II toxin-antitoxin system VapC family toxin [Pseudomonas sp. CBSPBW29]WEL65179.1 type II toxin-antitoxin system VapC family toxin [Pseudomonas sp. CBSPGW29]WEL68652.1 type II toxin-antitoxin system VapC family toxin [Pseudomonas sp. CBSPCGW29]WEL75662.1 type II toxin-antitoxin system VapC family toxin [Pseudomonas sp. CBSPAW29]WEL80091.1 type II toxin-antitoxin system VapC family toxin [Pseudomonas s
MRILLDTHILLWALSDDPKLSAKARKLIENAAEIYVSAATFWELAIKVGLGKLNVNLDEIREYCLESGYVELPITSEHAIAVKDLEHHHRDPFDRLIIATAIIEPMKLVTADPIVAKYTSLAVLT